MKKIQIFIDGVEVNLQEPCESIQIINTTNNNDIVIKSGCGIIIGDVKGDVTSKGNGPISVYGNIYGSARSTNGAIQVSGHVDIARSTNGSILVGRNNELTKISDVLQSVNNLLK